MKCHVSKVTADDASAADGGIWFEEEGEQDDAAAEHQELAIVSDEM